uniref:hypothetical protein n=1 Tax=Citrobacter koseri TaxID=545 RepID=UPI001F1B73F5
MAGWRSYTFMHESLRLVIIIAKYENKTNVYKYSTKITSVISLSGMKDNADNSMQVHPCRVKQHE